MSEPIVFRNSSFFLEDGIVFYSYLPDADETLDDAIAKTAKIATIYGDKKYPFLIYGENIRSMSRDSRSYYGTGDGARNIAAMAIVALSPLSRVLGNFFVGLSKPLYPVKMFDNKEEALAWLQAYKTN